MNTFILIVVITSGWGTTSISQEFTTYKNCRIALDDLHKNQTTRRMIDFGYCYKK